MRAALAALLIACLAACGPASRAPAKTDPRLDPLFSQLQSAPDAMIAAQVEAKIWAIWNQSGSPTVDILLERAEAAEAAGDLDLARKFLNEAAELLPTYAETYNRRAVLAFDEDDRAAALRDIEETLAREPRHFGAWAGLGLIYESMNQRKAALAAYEEALALHPFLDEARQGAERLKPAFDGRET